MENAVKIAAIAGPSLLLIGLSLLLHAKAWQKLVDKWQKDHLSLFPLVILMTILGIMIIRLYNVWEWNVWIIVTLLGWILFIKSVIYLLLPGSALKGIMRMGKNLGLLYFSGLLNATLGAVLTYYVYFA